MKTLCPVAFGDAPRWSLQEQDNSRNTNQIAVRWQKYARLDRDACPGRTFSACKPKLGWPQSPKHKPNPKTTTTPPALVTTGMADPGMADPEPTKAANKPPGALTRRRSADTLVEETDQEGDDDNHVHDDDDHLHQQRPQP